MDKPEEKLTLAEFVEVEATIVAAMILAAATAGKNMEAITDTAFSLALDLQEKGRCR